MQLYTIKQIVDEFRAGRLKHAVYSTEEAAHHLLWRLESEGITASIRKGAVLDADTMTTRPSWSVVSDQEDENKDIRTEEVEEQNGDDFAHRLFEMIRRGESPGFFECDSCGYRDTFPSPPNFCSGCARPLERRDSVA